MVDTAVLFGADESKAKEEMTEVLKFEMKLAKISTLKELRRDATKLYNPSTIGKLKTGKGLPESWTDFIQSLFDHPQLDITIDADEVVIIRDVEFLKRIGELISSTSDRVLANYIGKFNIHV